MILAFDVTMKESIGKEVAVHNRTVGDMKGSMRQVLPTTLTTYHRLDSPLRFFVGGARFDTTFRKEESS